MVTSSEEFLKYFGSFSIHTWEKRKNRVEILNSKLLTMFWDNKKYKQ